jgi:hypothetical protein
MSSKKKGGVQEGPLVKMLERQRVQKAAADAAKKLADASVDAAKKLADATKEAEETATCQSRGPLPLCQILFQ